MIAWVLRPAPRVIEPARPEDLTVLEEIHAASFPFGWSADEFAAFNSQPGVVTLVARRANLWASARPVGFLLARTAADDAEILTIAVHPRQRRSGVAHELVAVLLRTLYVDRIRSVCLEVDPDNRAAVALYRKFGFREVGAREHYYRRQPGDSARALVMRLEL